MTVPLLSPAIAALRTAILGIDGVAPYTHDVVTCELRSRDWIQVTIAQRPYVGIHIERIPFTYKPSRQAYGDAIIHLICLLPLDSNETTRTIAQLAMMDDLFRALEADFTFGRRVISTEIREVFFDAPDIDSQNAMRALVVMKHRRSTGGTPPP